MFDPHRRCQIYKRVPASEQLFQRLVFSLAKQKKARDNQIVRNPQESKGLVILHSKVTSKGQTTIPGKVRKALRIKSGDKLEYAVEGDHAIIRVHLGTRSLKGALASKKGKGMSFAQIRDAAANAARGRENCGEQTTAR